MKINYNIYSTPQVFLSHNSNILPEVTITELFYAYP